MQNEIEELRKLILKSGVSRKDADKVIKKIVLAAAKDAYEIKTAWDENKMLGFTEKQFLEVFASKNKL